METLRAILIRAQDTLADGKMPDESVITTLDKAYSHITNATICPCESGQPFEQCCKMIWMQVKRGIRGIKEETHETKKEIHQEEKKARDGVKWICRIGIGRKGEPVVDVVNMEGANMHPIHLAGVLLNAYHDEMMTSVELAAKSAVGFVASVIPEVQQALTMPNVRRH